MLSTKVSKAFPLILSVLVAWNIGVYSSFAVALPMQMIGLPAGLNVLAAIMVAFITSANGTRLFHRWILKRTSRAQGILLLFMSVMTLVMLPVGIGVILMVPALIVVTVTFRSRGNDLFIVGLLPTVGTYLSWVLVRGINFPGYCDRGDGLTCVSAGLWSYLQDTFSADGFGAVMLFIVEPIFILILVAIGAIVTYIFRPRLSRTTSLFVLVGLGGIFLLWDSITHTWSPPYSQATTMGYCVTGAVAPCAVAP